MECYCKCETVIHSCECECECAACTQRDAAYQEVIRDALQREEPRVEALPEWLYNGDESEDDTDESSSEWSETLDCDENGEALPVVDHVEIRWSYYREQVRLRELSNKVGTLDSCWNYHKRFKTMSNEEKAFIEGLKSFPAEMLEKIFGAFLESMERDYAANFDAHLATLSRAQYDLSTFIVCTIALHDQDENGDPFWRPTSRKLLKGKQNKVTRIRNLLETLLRTLTAFLQLSLTFWAVRIPKLGLGTVRRALNRHCEKRRLLRVERIEAVLLGKDC